MFWQTKGRTVSVSLVTMEAHIKRVCSEVFSSFPDFVQLSKDAAFETISDPKYSGKMKVLQQLLNHFRKNKDKVLLFSFSTKLLDVLEQYCMASGLDYRRLDGNTKSEDRMRIVREFNKTQEINICLVSTMAGGLGLNFVGANVVILFDPTWNPANDLQAIDRAYRIGQCKDVKVFRLISLGTVEEMMYLRQVYKQQLHCAVVGSENAKRYFEAVQGSKEHQGELFGIHNLFKLRTHGSCLTKEILEREGQVEAGVMTATTWLKEESPLHSSEKYGQPDFEGDGDPPSSKAQLEREEIDFHDDFSDDEMLEISMKRSDRKKPCSVNNSTVTKGQLSLMQCGFSKLLQREIETTKKNDGNDNSYHSSSDGQTTRTNVNSKGTGVQKRQSHAHVLEHNKAAQSPNGTDKQEMCSADWLVLSNSEEEEDREDEDQCISKQNDVVMETESSSEENDNIIFPTQVPACHQAVLTKRAEIRSSTTEHSVESAKDRFVFKRDGKQLGFCSTESNFSKIRSSEDVKNSARDLKGASDVSDESDDIEIPCNSESGKLRTFSFPRRKQRHAHSNELGNFSKSRLQSKPSRKEKESESQNIDEFSSSEDNLPVQKIHARKQSYKCKSQRRTVRFGSKILHPIQDTMCSVAEKKSSNYAGHKTYAHKAEFDHQDHKVESMDKYLDGVQEVAYIHSNQNVVGSSKAENHLSRWAVRDVFELKQFSQLPANVAVCSAKKDEETLEEEMVGTNIMKRGKEMMLNSKQHLYVVHPVIQKNKKVHRVGSTTFLVGKTPKEIRRRQFEEMVSHFNMGSVEELAEHITKVTSETRQKMLKEFYISKHPEMASLFPVEIPAQVSHDYVEKEADARNSRKRKSVVNFGRRKSRLSSAKELLSGTTGMQKQQSCEEVEQLHNDSCLQDNVCVKNTKYKQSLTDATQYIERRNSQAFKDFMASGSLSSKSEIIEVLSVKSCEEQQDSEVTELPRKRSLSQSENKERKAKTYKKPFVDLLGDTSILDDLFGNGGNEPTESPRRIPSGQVEKSKERPKDFWDMLNEQNEESLRKLTDLAVIEELCERAPHPPVTEKRGVCESSLWKKNENFLWKKHNIDDPDEPSTATSCDVAK
ncbi:DNA excision repair protein ERCC-6-like 2 isoform X4 [Anser cygnoides]|uniref:DNA excision repair protein ERCC-6-like 2 isoform X4 n=1 Tax=Anser cygnoides TaxID=8845 RepID=UPI0034D16752